MILQSVETESHAKIKSRGVRGFTLSLGGSFARPCRGKGWAAHDPGAGQCRTGVHSPKGAGDREPAAAKVVGGQANRLDLAASAFELLSPQLASLAFCPRSVPTPLSQT